MGNGGPERGSNLPELTQHISGRAINRSWHQRESKAGTAGLIYTLLTSKKCWVPTMHQALNSTSQGHGEEWDIALGPDELGAQCWRSTDECEVRPQGEACRVLRAGTQGPENRGGWTSLSKVRAGFWWSVTPERSVFQNQLTLTQCRKYILHKHTKNIFHTNTHTHKKVPPDYSYLCTYLVSLRGFFF